MTELNKVSYEANVAGTSVGNLAKQPVDLSVERLKIFQELDKYYADAPNTHGSRGIEKEVERTIMGLFIPFMAIQEVKSIAERAKKIQECDKQFYGATIVSVQGVKRSCEPALSPRIDEMCSRTLDELVKNDKKINNTK